MSSTSTSKKRGLATLSPERRTEIARMGGTAAHKSGGAHTFTSDEAIAAARKGHESRRRKKS